MSLVPPTIADKSAAVRPKRVAETLSSATEDNKRRKAALARQFAICAMYLEEHVPLTVLVSRVDKVEIVSMALERIYVKGLIGFSDRWLKELIEARKEWKRASDTQ